MWVHHRKARTRKVPRPPLDDPHSAVMARTPWRSSRLDVDVCPRRGGKRIEQTHLSLPRHRVSMVAPGGVRAAHHSGRLHHVTTNAERDPGASRPATGARSNRCFRRRNRRTTDGCGRLVPVLAIGIDFLGSSAGNVSRRLTPPAHSQLHEQVRNVVLDRLLGEEHLF